MRILLVRHGIAEDREAWVKSRRADEDRPLTRAGRRKLRKAARGLKRVLPDIEALASSPLARAVESARALAREFPETPLLQISHLLPRKPLPALLAWLKTQPRRGTIALVGHEPQLSTFAGWMTTGLTEPFLVLKKGGMCLLETGADPRQGRAKMLWALSPSQLRKLA